MIERDGACSVERAALERAVGNLVRNARKHGQGRVTITVGGDDGDGASSASSDEGPGSRPSAEHAFERFWRGAGARARAPASAWRSCARSPSATAAASTVDGVALHARPSQELSRSRPYNCRTD